MPTYLIIYYNSILYLKYAKKKIIKKSLGIRAIRVKIWAWKMLPQNHRPEWKKRNLKYGKVVNLLMSFIRNTKKLSFSHAVQL